MFIDTLAFSPEMREEAKTTALSPSQREKTTSDTQRIRQINVFNPSFFNITTPYIQAYEESRLNITSERIIPLVKAQAEEHNLCLVQEDTMHF